MKVLIVGAGMAGLTFASFLKEHKHFEVDIIEKQKDWSHMGFTIGIWDLGRQILAKLDLAEEFDKHSVRINSYYLATKDNSIIKLYHFDEFYKKYETAYSHISREILHEMLLKKSKAKIQMNTTVASLNRLNGLTEVKFSNGKKKRYDLIVASDGIHSGMRKLIFKNDELVYTGNRAWYAWIDKSFGKGKVLEYIGSKSICNIFDDPKQTCLVLTAQENPKTKDDPKDRIERLQRHFSEFEEPIREIINSLKPDKIVSTDIAYLNSKNLIKGNIVFIGDAAHAMEPFAGIGASMGMEDAYVLAEELVQMKSLSHLNITLQRYLERRLPRIEIARNQTRMHYWWIKSQIPGMVMIRNWFAKIIPINHFTNGYKILLETKP